MNNPREQYSQAKSQRHQAQREKLEEVLKIEGPSQAAFLFKLWPERLPQLVRRQISSDTLTRWRGLRSQQNDRRMDEMLRLEIEMMVHAALEEEGEGFEEALRERHGKAAAEVERLIASFNGPRVVTVMFDVNQGDAEEDDETEARVGSFDLAPGEGLSLEARTGICAALQFGGGIIVRHSLPLRVQVATAQGPQWMAQEKLYGVAMGGGEWEAMSEAQVRECYMFDSQTGAPLQREPNLVFGDMRPVARRLPRAKGEG